MNPILYSRLLFLLFAFITVQTISAQKKIFFNQQWEKTKEKNAVYYRIVNAVDNQFKVEDYFKESNQLQMSGTYTSNKLLNNSREGIFIYYFSNGNKSSEGTYKKGKRVGVWKSWFKNGQLKSEGNYDDDLRQGSFVFYHKNGVVKSKTTFVDNEKDGLSIFYFDNGNLDEEFSFFKGKKNGYFKTFYENGNIKSKGNYEKDSLLGDYESYWKNGNLSFKGNYTDNKRNGVQVYYHSNGKKSCEVEYKNGVFIDAYFYDEEGVKIDKKVFKDDLIVKEVYPGGNDALSELINKQIGKKVDLETAQYQGLVYEIYVQLNIDEKGLITERKWLMPDEEDEIEDVWGFVKNFNNVIDIMPRFQPLKSYNRYIGTSCLIYYKIVFTKKNISTFTKLF